MKLQLLWHLATKDALAHAFRSSLIMALTAALAFFAYGLMRIADSVSDGIGETIRGSVTGDLQVYSKSAKDDFELIGSDRGTRDYGFIEDYPKVEKALEALESVKAVVPMGVVYTTFTSPSPLEYALGVARRDLDNEEYSVSIVRRALRELWDSIQARGDELTESERTALERALSDEFWTDNDSSLLERLDFLDSFVAPLGGDGRLSNLFCLGTDVNKFLESFPKARLVRGKAPDGDSPGLMLNRSFLRRQLKHPTLRILDRIEERRREGATFENSPLIRSWAESLREDSSQLGLAVSWEKRDALQAALGKALGDQGDFDQQLKHLFQLTDKNYQARKTLVEEELIPRMKAFEFDLGDEIVIQSMTRSGFLRYLKVPVTGVLEFSGLDASGLSSAFNLVDLGSFRELLGAPTKAEAEEMQDIRSELPSDSISRENAEDLLFGEASDQADGEPAKSDTDQPRVLLDSDNVVLSAAVIRTPGSGDRSFQAEVERAATDAKLDLRVAGWADVSGLFGMIAKLSPVIVLLLLIIGAAGSGSVVYSALSTSMHDRQKDFGILRTLGSGRVFVQNLMVFQNLCISLVGALVGVGVSVALVGWLATHGIESTSAMLVMAFGGTKLFPSNDLFDALVIVGVMVLFVGLVTLRPARRLGKTSPILTLQEGA